MSRVQKGQCPLKRNYLLLTSQLELEKETSRERKTRHTERKTSLRRVASDLDLFEMSQGKKSWKQWGFSKACGSALGIAVFTVSSYKGFIHFTHIQSWRESTREGGNSFRFGP